MSNLLIREYCPKDKKDIIQLWEQAFPHDPTWNNPEEIILRKVACQDNLFFVGSIDNVIIATALAGYDGFRGWVYHLAVHKTHRHADIGSQMMYHIEDILRKRGCIKINLQVRSSNQQVIDFYRSIGYTIEDHTSMGKLL